MFFICGDTPTCLQGVELIETWTKFLNKISPSLLEHHGSKSVDIGALRGVFLYNVHVEENSVNKRSSY